MCYRGSDISEKQSPSLLVKEPKPVWLLGSRPTDTTLVPHRRLAQVVLGRLMRYRSSVTVTALPPKPQLERGEKEHEG
jgi:hypothetical protein